MSKKAISALLAAVMGGALIWYKRQQPSKSLPRRQVREEVPLSATSLSSQPHKRVRLRPPASQVNIDAPPPDSAASGRTPFYFVPGEALLTLQGPSPISNDTFLQEVASHFKGQFIPVGQGAISYPAPKSEEWLTVLRLQWPDSTGYNQTLANFVRLEEQVNQRVRWDEGRVVSWMPNWLGTLAGMPDSRMYTPGGPGAYPRPTATPKGGLSLTDAPFLAQWRAEMQKDVTFAILDAFPVAEEITDEHLTSMSPSLVPLLHKLRDTSHSLSLNAEAHYATFHTGESFTMSDHGLMTAWLASEVIGQAGMEHVTLEPVRVAAANGVCSAADVIAGLAPLAQRVQEGEPLVILLAFVIGMGQIIPPRLRPYEEHHEALRLLCLSISDAGGILLGPAGNDASGLQHPPRTRLPAAFRSVIDVTAGQLQQSDLALYANQSKALCLFGGESNLLYEMVDNLPALVGPAITSSLRSSNEQIEANPHGWVKWAGTSFAAALAAGLATLRVSHNPDFSMWAIRTQLRQVATDARHPGNVPFIDLVWPS